VTRNFSGIEMISMDIKELAFFANYRIHPIFSHFGKIARDELRKNPPSRSRQASPDIGKTTTTAYAAIVICRIGNLQAVHFANGMRETHSLDRYACPDGPRS
jgi:hypothetical protein